MNKYLLDAATFPGDARHAWRTDGVRGVCAELAERTLYRLARISHYHLFERDLATITHVAPPDNIEVRMLARSEHAMLGTLMSRRHRVQLERDTAARTIFAALRDGVVVGYSWWTPDFDGALDFSPLAVPADAIFHGFVHVTRSERHRGVGTALFSAGERYFLDRGARSCWFLIKSANRAYVRTALERWGGRARYVARLSCWKLPVHSKRRLTVANPA